MGAADDEAEEPPARHRGQAGVARRRELVDDRRRIGRPVGELPDQPCGDPVGVEPRRHRTIGQGGVPVEGESVGAVEAGAAVDHLVSVIVSPIPH